MARATRATRATLSPSLLLESQPRSHWPSQHTVDSHPYVSAKRHNSRARSDHHSSGTRDAMEQSAYPDSDPGTTVYGPSLTKEELMVVSVPWDRAKASVDVRARIVSSWRRLIELPTTTAHMLAHAFARDFLTKSDSELPRKNRALHKAQSTLKVMVAGDSTQSRCSHVQRKRKKARWLPTQ